MPEPTYDFSGLQKRTVAPPPSFNFSGLKTKATAQGADTVLLPQASPQNDLSSALLSPFKNFAAGAKELFVDKGNTPLIPLTKLIPKTEKPLPGAYNTLAGVGRGVAGLIEGFTTPKNLAIAVATGGVGAIPIIGKVGLPAIEAFFAYEAAKQVPDLWRTYQKAPVADKPELMTQIIGSIGIAGLAGRGAAKKVVKLGKEAKALTDVSPEVPQERILPAGELFEPPAQVKRGRQELETSAKIAQEVGELSGTAKAQDALKVSKQRFQEELSTPQLQLEALTEEITGKPIKDLSVKQKAEANRKAVVEYRKRLAQNAEVVAFEQGKILKDIPVEERGIVYEEARERLRQELIEGKLAVKTEAPRQDIGALAKKMEGVTGPVPQPPVRPKLVTERQALQEDWLQKQVQDGDFLREPTIKNVFEKTTGIAFTDNFNKEFQAWEKTNGSAFELGDAEVFANQKKAALSKNRALAEAEKPKEIKIIDLAAPVEKAAKPVDSLVERRRIVSEKRQQLAEERLELQEQRLEAQRQKAIEQLAGKYRVTGLKKKKSGVEAKGAEGATKAQISAQRPSEQYAGGQKTVQSLTAKYKEQAIPKSEWAGLAKLELEKQGYSPRIVSELTEPRRTTLEQAPSYETSRAGRIERAVEPSPELKPKVDAVAETARPNQIAQADYERARQDILEEIQKDPNLKVYFDSGEGNYKIEVLQKQKLAPEALAAIQELRKQAALEGGYSLETVGHGHEIAVTPEGFYEGKPLTGATLTEKIGDLIERKKTADTTHEAFVKAKNKAEPDLVDRHLTEEGAAPLLGKTAAGENVEIVTRRNRSAIEPDAPEWVQKIEQAKRTGAKESGDPYVAIYRVTEATAKRAEKGGFTFLRKNLSEADNARLDAVIENMTKASNELSANPVFNIKIGLEAYKNLTEIGFLTLKAAGRALSKSEWITHMLDPLRGMGESVRPFLDDIWESIQKGWKPGSALEIPRAFAERDPKAVSAKETLTKEEPPASAGDKLNEWARNVKLASTSSLIRSGFGGNLTMQILKTPKRLIAAGANRALAAVTGAKRDRFGQEAATELYGTLRTMKQGVDEALHVIREDPEALKNSLFLSQETGRTTGAIGVGLPEGARFKELREKGGRLIRMPQKLQGAIDAIFRVPSGQGLIDMLAVRQAFKEGLEGEAWVKRVEQIQNETRAGNTELGKQLLEQAKTEAAEMTFQSELGEFGRKVNALREIPGVRFMVPFFNTWVNLWKQGIRHTPLNVLRPTFIRSVQKAFSKNPELKSIGGFSDEIAAMTAGTAFSLLSYGFFTKVLEGDIIGYGPEDQKERQRLFASGWKPYSLKLGDNYISFKGFEPVSTWLTMMADANEGRKKEGALGLFDGVSENVVRNFIENPFLTGITETMDALRGDARPEEFLAGMALGATIPTFLQQSARVIDSNYRQTPKDADVLEKFAAEYAKRVPFLSKTLPSDLDVFGKEKTVDSPALRYLAVNISKQDRGAIHDELRRLDLGIGFPRDTYKGLDLTEPQMRELLVLAGGRMEKALAKLVVSPGYKQLRDEEKKTAITYVVNKVRNDSKEFLFKHLATKAKPKNRGSAVAKPFAR